MKPRSSGMLCALTLILAAGAATARPGPSMTRAANQPVRKTPDGQPIAENPGAPAASQPGSAQNPEAKPMNAEAKPAAPRDKWSRMGSVRRKSDAAPSPAGESNPKPISDPNAASSVTAVSAAASPSVAISSASGAAGSNTPVTPLVLMIPDEDLGFITATSGALLASPVASAPERAMKTEAQAPAKPVANDAPLTNPSHDNRDDGTKPAAPNHAAPPIAAPVLSPSHTNAPAQNPVPTSPPAEQSHEIIKPQAVIVAPPVQTMISNPSPSPVAPSAPAATPQASVTPSDLNRRPMLANEGRVPSEPAKASDIGHEPAVQAHEMKAPAPVAPPVVISVVQPVAQPTAHPNVRPAAQVATQPSQQPVVPPIAPPVVQPVAPPVASPTPVPVAPAPVSPSPVIAPVMNQVPPAPVAAINIPLPTSVTPPVALPEAPPTPAASITTIQPEPPAPASASQPIRDIPSPKPASEAQPAPAPSDVNQLITPFPRIVPVPDEVKTPSADSVLSREPAGLGAGVAAKPLSIPNVTAPAAKPIPAAPASTPPIANPSPSPMPSQVPLGDLSVNSRLLQSMQTLPNGRRVLPESHEQASSVIDGSAGSSPSTGADDLERSNTKRFARQSTGLEEAIILQPADLLRASSGGSSNNSDVRRLGANPNQRSAAVPPALNLRDTISKGKSSRNSIASPLVFLPVRGKASARNQVNTSPFGPLPTTDRMSSAQPGRD